MKKLCTFISGIACGFVLAHFANQTETGRAIFARINQVTDEIKEAVISGYNEAE